MLNKYAILKKMKKEGSMRKRTAIIFCAFVMLFPDAHIKSERWGTLCVKLSEEQSVIHQALIDSVGKDIQLKYHQNRLITVQLLLLQTLMTSQRTRQLSAMKKEFLRQGKAQSELTPRPIDGKWQSVYELHGMGNRNWQNYYFKSLVRTNRRTYYRL